MKISATVIVHNEEDNIAEVCESVAWADEIIIVDSDSTDRTVEIAKQYTDKILNREFKGFKDKHEFADAQTTGDWIFWIDADERVSDELRASIANLREYDDSKLADGYKISRKTFFMDRWIRHCGWSPDYQMRLYRKNKSYWDGVAPHQTARVDGRVETLDGKLLHYTKSDLSEYHRVTNSYATLAAEYLAAEGKTVGAFGIFTSAVAAFIRTYILKQGFRDGVPGLMISMFTAYGVFLKYAKVWEINRSN
ncbi:MAG: glycosyltransferase family 2 protein [Pyrinomonadaceae bacterium]